MEQRIGFATSNDGTRIAYAVSGDGPGLPVVRVASVATHLELDQDSVIWGRFWRFLSAGRTLIRYDMRGGGLSDRFPEDYSLDARVEDLESVVDNLKIPKFILLCHGFGVPVGVEYASRHLDNVARLVLLSGSGRGFARIGANMTVYSDLLRGNGGFPALSADRLMASVLFPNTSRDQMEEGLALINGSISGEVAAKITENATTVDVTDQIPEIKIPALVLHSVESLSIPVGEGRLLASMLPNARFVELDSENQVLMEGEPAWQTFKREVTAFLGDFAPTNPRSSESPLIEGLSLRESEVLRAVAEGATDREIGHALGISMRTVGNHVKSILRKTDSASRAQAAVWAARRGLL